MRTLSASSAGAAYRVMPLAFVAMFASAPGQSFFFAVFVDSMRAGTGLSSTLYSALYTAATVFSATVAVLLGRAADRLSLRVIWAAVATCLALACGVASVADGVVLALIAVSLLRAFGQGSFPLIAAVLIARSVGHNRGRAMAVANFGFTAASTALPPLVVVLITAVGWRHAYQVVGLAALVLVLPLGWFVPPPRRPAAVAAEQAAEIREFPEALRRSRRLLRVEVPHREALKLLLILAAPALVTTAIVFHAVSLLGGRGFSAPEAGAALSALGLATIAGTFLAGALADRASARLVLVLLVGGLAVGSAMLLIPSGAVAFAGFAVLGLSTGFFGVVSRSIWMSVYGVARIGRLQGLASAAGIAAAALGPLPLALSRTLSGGYEAGLAGLLAYTGVTLVIALRWREPIVRSTPGQTASV